MDWKAALGNLAPILGSAFGPLGTAGGLAIRQLLGLPSDASDADLQSFIQTPEGALKVKQAEYDYKIAIMAQETERFRIDKEDRDGARDREKVVKDNIPARLAGVTIVGFFATVGYVLSGKVALNGEVGILIGTIVGYVSAKADQVLSYYFGSSSSSKTKDATIQTMMSK